MIPLLLNKLLTAQNDEILTSCDTLNHMLHNNRGLEDIQKVSNRLEESVCRFNDILLEQNTQEDNSQSSSDEESVDIYGIIKNSFSVTINGFKIHDYMINSVKFDDANYVLHFDINNYSFKTHDGKLVLMNSFLNSLKDYFDTKITYYSLNSTEVIAEEDYKYCSIDYIQRDDLSNLEPKPQAIYFGIRYDNLD